jgi:hypothetical protein
MSVFVASLAGESYSLATVQLAHRSNPRRGIGMHAVALGIAALAIASIYYIWRTYREVKTHRDQILRERVALMLWKAADRDGADARK